MVDREHVLAVLRKRFREATARQFAEAANAIVALPDEWEEVHVRQDAKVRVFRQRRVAPDAGRLSP